MRNHVMWFGLALAMVLLNVSSGWCQVSEWPGPTPGQLDPLIAWQRGYIEGYTPTPSVRQGDVVEFKLSTTAAWVPGGPNIPRRCAMDIYRVTSRTPLGAGDQLMQANVSDSIMVDFYPLRDSAGGSIEPFDYSRYPYDYRRGCNDLWATAARCTVQNTWPSGFYYARVHLVNEGNYGYVPFVVRPRDPANSQAKILCVISWNTYQAYNYWGGGSLYWWLGRFGSPDDGGTSIKTVSFRRPFTDFWQVAPPAGWPITTQLGQVDSRERQFIAWAEENTNDYPVDYCIDADVNAAAGGDLLTSYKMLVFPGHSEYWTFDQRRNIEHQQSGFKGQGGNLAFLAANNCYWRVDYRPSAPPTANPDSMYCDKSGNNYWWRKQPVDTATSVGGPEARFIGVQYMGNNYPGYQGPDTLVLASHWISRSTGLASGSVFGRGNNEPWFVNRLEPIASGEADMVRMASPSTTQKLGSVFIRSLDSLNDPHYNEEGTTQLHSNVTYYEDITTNSRVFAAGGFGWSHCLYGDDSTTMRIMHRAVLDHFSGKKYIGNVYTSPDHPLIWSTNIELDGDVLILSNKKVIIVSTQVTVDSVLFVDGTCEINGAVTVAGAGSLNINPGGTLLLKANSTLTISPSAYFVLESGGDVVFESGAKLILNHATVEAGATLSVESGGTLQVQPDGQIVFGVSSGLSISGTLTAQGTSTNPIAFARSGMSGTWNGVVIGGYGTCTMDYVTISHANTAIKVPHNVAATISHCEIEDGTIGIHLYESGSLVDLTSTEVTFNTISNQSSTGILVDEGANYALIQDNTLEGVGGDNGMLFVGSSPTLILRNHISGWTNGIMCLEASPSFVDGENGGHNCSVNNGYGLWADESANPVFGIDEGIAPGYNSLAGNSNYQVVLKKECYVAASLCFFREGGPDPGDFDIDASSYLETWPPLSDDPNKCLGEQRLLSGLGGTGGEEPMLRLTDSSAMRQAVRLRVQGLFQPAIDTLKNIIASSGSKPELVRWALYELVANYQQIQHPSGTNRLSPYMRALLQAQTNTNARRAIRQVLAGALLHEQDISAMLSMLDETIENHPNTSSEMLALYRKFGIGLNMLDNHSLAENAMQALQSRYPASNLTQLATVLMAIFESAQNRSLRNSPVAKMQDGNDNLPAAFSLSQNYPNPFNPSTIVRYDLPLATHTHLKMYDILGREVASLVDEDKSAGHHQVSFDGSRFSSGVYFYRMEAGSYSSVKKLLLVQ